MADTGAEEVVERHWEVVAPRGAEVEVEEVVEEGAPLEHFMAKASNSDFSTQWEWDTLWESRYVFSLPALSVCRVSRERRGGGREGEVPEVVEGGGCTPVVEPRGRTMSFWVRFPSRSSNASILGGGVCDEEVFFF